MQRRSRAQVFGLEFFDLSFGATLLILLLFVSVFLAITMALLRRRPE
jgi:hypothetical protein